MEKNNFIRLSPIQLCGRRYNVVFYHVCTMFPLPSLVIKLLNTKSVKKKLNKYEAFMVLIIIKLNLKLNDFSYHDNIIFLLSLYKLEITAPLREAAKKSSFLVVRPGH